MTIKNTPKFDETKRVDDWQCPWCGEINEIRMINDLSMASTVYCPKCEKEVYIMPSIEFTCVPTVDGEPVEKNE